MSAVTAAETVAPTFEHLRARFAPIFEEIGAGVLEREADRRLPYEQIDRLRREGFGALRVPVEYGGFGLTLVEQFRLLIDLAVHDSNSAHVWRGHIAFVEEILIEKDAQRRDRWLTRIGRDRDLIGNAWSEVGNRSWEDSSTVLSSDGDGGYTLDGEKYYTTGTIFAQWTSVAAQLDGERVFVAARLDDPGVTIVDDWNGFGQRLTGTGTTRFVKVPVAADEIRRSAEHDTWRSSLVPLFQLVLLAALAGIARAAVDDIVRYVLGRNRRALDGDEDSSPRDDVLVQRAVGEVSAAAEAAEAIVLSAARALDDAHDVHDAEEADARPVFDRARLAAFRGQTALIPLVLSATERIFEVGGSSAVAAPRALDRHWRNARTVASHNPVDHRARAIGYYELFGEFPERRRAGTTAPTSAAASSDAASAKKES
ncbi:alkylation response protein AidB-like acyl-CoA dehydrogenase [Microbacterium ginsengiterrae]|uniref:Alkylation response protein AidB-like acyl-CoA dehydrogenase n=1 Tax=Microbacterium ginsengiterrae TaxID=546115 RepID=A0A7W9CCK4_9MICO|nr:acyl-CoA dehydrogenase family protein [Microbacterium ginsengiterrae]MBB5742998.1 alkylation response protein AidB-like acyl-CoA dehydrogenase [Microbacterium ginsengiterrae]